MEKQRNIFKSISIQIKTRPNGLILACECMNRPIPETTIWPNFNFLYYR